MALCKLIETKSGITISYWRIIGYRYNILIGLAEIEVIPYLDAAARAADKQPISNEGKAIRILGTDINAIGPDVLSAAAVDGKSIYNVLYTYLKTTPEFEGAEDC